MDFPGDLLGTVYVTADRWLGFGRPLTRGHQWTTAGSGVAESSSDPLDALTNTVSRG